MSQTPREISILVVEDEAIIAEDIRTSLEDLGYRVVATCATGGDAIAHARALHPDLILMDIHLRGEMDGLDAATHIANEQDIPIVFLTAYHDDKTLARATRAQPYGFVIKPFEDRDLHSTIGIALFKHQMESQLKASERWLAAVLRGIGDAVMTVDAEGLVRSMNPQAEVLTGWRQQDAIGQSIDRVLSLDDEPPAEALSPHPGDGERVLCTQHGQRLPIEMTASAIVDEREGDVGTVIIFRNISQRKAMERALIQQAEELSRSNEELQRFAYVVSHDLRSPLNVVGMSLSALQHTYAERLDERGRRFIERGNQSVRRMGQLIDDLLSYARVQSQAAPLEPIAAGEVLQTAVENLEAAITENSAQISHDPLPQVLADRT
jgi:PAS domain S-box-containing protein